MNNIELIFQELKNKQFEVLFNVCTYIHESLQIDDFNLFSQIHSEPDFSVEEIFVEIVHTGQIINIFDINNGLNQKVEDLRLLQDELINLLNFVVEAETNCVYFLKANDFNEFCNQFII